MAMKSKKTFPMLFVNLALLVCLLPVSFLFRFESLTNQVKFRWKSNIRRFTLDKVDYRKQIMHNEFTIVAFAIWAFQVLVTLIVVLYHILVPHHPKFYSTKKNTVSIICHMIGGTIGILGLFIGALANQKPLCIVAVVFGMTMHLPSVIWQSRQTHGQRETSVPSYAFLAWVLFQSYIEFFLYDGDYQTVFTCAMTLNVFAMVRLFGFLAEKSHVEANVDKSVLLAGFCNSGFIGGPFFTVIFIFSLFLWNAIFDCIKPFPRYMLRIERGYNDAVPDHLEDQRGIHFTEELTKEQAKCKDRKEAITRAVWNVLAMQDHQMQLKEVVELYAAWGMPDAEEAALATFEKVDEDDNDVIDYNEFKEGFDHIIEGIYLKGEYESIRSSNIKTMNQVAPEGVVERAITPEETTFSNQVYKRDSHGSRSSRE